MKKDMHFVAIKPIFENAAYLRKNMTHEERIVWNCLSANKMGFKFRRQHPIWMYIADFYCHELRLVIEIDGGIHLGQDIKAQDAIRENDLHDFGIEVLRFTNEEVRCNLPDVTKTITTTIIKLSESLSNK